jgi:hypothetical protein
MSELADNPFHRKQKGNYYGSESVATALEQAQSNRARNIFIFVVFGGFQSSLFIYCKTAKF